MPADTGLPSASSKQNQGPSGRASCLQQASISAFYPNGRKWEVSHPGRYHCRPPPQPQPVFKPGLAAQKAVAMSRDFTNLFQAAPILRRLMVSKRAVHAVFLFLLPLCKYHHITALIRQIAGCRLQIV